jgi:hypothetical protein
VYRFFLFLICSVKVYLLERSSKQIKHMSGYFVDTFSREIQHISVSTLHKNKVTTLSFSLYLPCLAVQDNQTLNCRTSLVIWDLRSANQMPPFQEISSSQASIIFSKTRISATRKCHSLYRIIQYTLSQAIYDNLYSMEIIQQRLNSRDVKHK